MYFRTTAQRCATHEALAHIYLTILVEWVTTRVLSGVTVVVFIAGIRHLTLKPFEGAVYNIVLKSRLCHPTAGLDLVRRLHSSSTGLSRATSTTLFTPLHRPEHGAERQGSSQGTVQHYLFLLSSSIGSFALIFIRSICTSEIAPWLFKADHVRLDACDKGTSLIIFCKE